MPSQLESILGRERLTAFLEPGAIKRGLPPAAYCDHGFFRLEQEKVFRKTWALAGFAHEVPNPGDARPTTLGGVPILLLRDGEGTLRVFHNVCRHRNMKLVDEPCSGLKKLLCPYHAWTYNLDGSLRLAPYFGGSGLKDTAGLDYAKHGLLEARSAVFHDWVFVNVSGDAPPFEEYIAPLVEQIGDLGLSELKPIFAMDSGEVAANWKFLCENYVEPYHVPVTHPQTAAGQPLQSHHMVRKDHLVGCAAEVDAAAAAAAQDGKTNGSSDLFLNFSAWYYLLFPNFLFFVYFAEATHVYVMLNTPLAPDRTHQRRVIYQLGGEAPDAAEIEAWRKLNAQVIAEDWFMATRLQAGRASPAAEDGGVFSPTWDASSHAFDELIISAMKD
jgi:choline monooxygenase